MNTLNLTLHLDTCDHVGLKTIAAFDGKTEDAVAHEMVTTTINSRMETMSWEWSMLAAQRDKGTLENEPAIPVAELAISETFCS
ncbi:MAG: hypothetical protein ACOY3I_08825 [Verrucomicrobiota bacterium]